MKEQELRDVIIEQWGVNSEHAKLFDQIAFHADISDKFPYDAERTRIASQLMATLTPNIIIAKPGHDELMAAAEIATHAADVLLRQLGRTTPQSLVRKALNMLERRLEPQINPDTTALAEEHKIGYASGWRYAIETCLRQINEIEYYFTDK